MTTAAFRQPALFARTRSVRAPSTDASRLGREVIVSLADDPSWESCAPLEPSGSSVQAVSAVRHVDGGLLRQAYTDVHEPRVFAVELDMRRDDPWSLALFWLVERREVFAMQMEPCGRWVQATSRLPVAYPGTRTVDPAEVAYAMG